MERYIIQGIQRLRVLTPYDYDNMDELVHDLSNALEESSCHRSASKSKKGKCWKRRPKLHSATLIPLGSSVPKSSAVSDDSESSFEFRMQRQTEASGSQPQSDSDDLSHKRNRQILSWRHCVASLVESDSVNENFLPMRAHRRKRKFKRMAVDPQPSDLAASANAAFSMSPKPRKVKSVRAVKMKGKHSKALDVMSVGDIEQKIVTFCGKRKRSMREKSLECVTRLEDGQEFRVPANCNLFCEPNSSGHHFMDCDDPRGKYQIEASSSSLSSSESDGGVLTNDEAREADDEHSDFFCHESGAELGMSELGAWWDDDQDGDPRFEALLAGSFQHMSEDAKKAYHAKVQRLMMGAGTHREIRAGRRRLGQVRPSFSVLSSVNESISKFMQDPQLNENTTQAINVNLANCRTSIGDIKRRRRMPPPIGIITTAHTNDAATQISESNIGNRILRSMGWEPGTGLGANGQGIQIPLMACLRNKYQGLGYDLNPLGCPPPPPPPSPQPLAASSGGETTSHSESIDATSPLVVNHFQGCQEEKATSTGLR